MYRGWQKADCVKQEATNHALVSNEPFICSVRGLGSPSSVDLRFLKPFTLGS